MRTWKLVSGILSIVFVLIILVQSCAVGVYNALNESNDIGGTAGFLVAILMIASGIISISTRGGFRKGGNIALIIINNFTFVLAISNAKVYKDLIMWGLWCFLCSFMACISLYRMNKGFAE